MTALATIRSFARPLTVALTAALTLAFVAALAGSAQAQQRSGSAPCRQGALALIAMLDDSDDKSADYRNAFNGVTQSCGPVSKARDITPSPRGECRKLALAVLDAIEGGRIQTPVFVRARDQFAASCAPR